MLYSEPAMHTCVIIAIPYAYIPIHKIHNDCCMCNMYAYIIVPITCMLVPKFEYLIA